LAAVGRFEDHLAAVVDRAVIERVDRQGRRPVAAVPRCVGWRVERVDPGAHRAGMSQTRVVACHLIAVTGRPHDVRIGEIGQGEAGLAAAEPALPRHLAAAEERAAPAPALAAPPPPPPPPPAPPPPPPPPTARPAGPPHRLPRP